MQTIRLDIASGGEYLHQKKFNKIRPAITCASSSAGMALLYSGYLSRLTPFVKNPTEVPDFITNYIHTSPTVLGFWASHPEKWVRSTYQQYQEFLAGTRPLDKTTFGNEVHPIMEFAINNLLQEKIDSFSWTTPIGDIAWNLLRGGAVIVSGSWPHHKLGSMAHVVCLTGFTTQQENILSLKRPRELDTALITSWWVDDPYGNYQVKYEGAQGENIQSGDNIEVPSADFAAFIWPLKDTMAKRAHLIKPIQK